MTDHKPRLAIVRSHEWTGLYVDGDFVTENHDLQYDVLLKHVGIECDFVDVDEDWLDRHGSLPNRIEDVKRSRG